VIAKTAASGGPGLLPEVLAFTSSLGRDRAMAREDLLGSLAHLTMLAQRRIVPEADARLLRATLVTLFEQASAGTLRLPDEEDVHMAIESLLAAQLGEVAGRLHTARSRNDQVTLDLRIHVREGAAQLLEALATTVQMLAARARVEGDAVMPSYTHRQRAQPISIGYQFCGWAEMFARDLDLFGFVLTQVDAMPLGVGAIAGTTLPIDRELTRSLLGFTRITANGLDTVGDRDFGLDYSYAASRCLIHAGRMSADLVDFSSSEFGLVKLGSALACGSSLMPQKRNPDLFELVRGRSAQGIAGLVWLLTLVKGLPTGYNRDLQEDRAVLLQTGALVGSVLSAIQIALPEITFDHERCREAVAGDYLQATDLAEGLVTRGIPFRTAYQAVGLLVKQLQEAHRPLATLTLDEAQAAHPAFDRDLVALASIEGAVARRESAGGTGPGSVKHQIADLERRAQSAQDRARQVPRIDALFEALKEAPL
jgi:argininosuccinate lyase